MRKGTVPYYNDKLGRDAHSKVYEWCDVDTFRNMLKSFPRSVVTISIRGWLAFNEDLVTQSMSLSVKGLGNRGAVWVETPKLLKIFPELRLFVSDMKVEPNGNRPWADRYITLGDCLMNADWIATLLNRPVTFEQHPGGKYVPEDFVFHGPYRPRRRSHHKILPINLAA